MTIQTIESAEFEIVEDPKLLLRKMIEIRKFEEKIEELFLIKGILIGPAHLYLGQEAVAVGVCSNLRKEDLIVTTYRCHGHALAKGVPMKKLMKEMFGKKGGTCKGLGGSMHAAIDVENGVMLATAIVGSGIPIAAGIAFANKYQNKDLITVCFFGDGATNTGAFHEGMNIAALWKLPIIFVCENNLYAMSTHISRAISSSNIAERAASYKQEVLVVDGNDVISVYRATKMAVEMIRKGEGPVFIEARTYKMKGHGVYDEGKYRDPREVNYWLSRDPIRIYKEKLIERKIINEEEVKSIEKEISSSIEEAVNEAIKDEVLDFKELYNLVWA